MYIRQLWGGWHWHLQICSVRSDEDIYGHAISASHSVSHPTICHSKVGLRNQESGSSSSAQLPVAAATQAPSTGFTVTQVAVIK